MKVSLFKLNRLDSEQLNPVYYKISNGRNDQPILATGLSVQGKYWKSGQVSTSHPNSTEVNARLRELRNKGEEAQNRWMYNEFKNTQEVKDFLDGKQNNSSIESYLHTILKDTITQANYDDLRWKLSAFKAVLGIKRDMHFTEVTNQLYAKFNKVGKELVKNGEKSPVSLKKYGQAVTYICKQAYRMGFVKEPIIIDSFYLKFPKQYKEPEYHSPEEIDYAIQNVQTIEQWQSVALWLLMFGLRGINDVDIVRISDKRLREIKTIRGKEQLVSVENKDFMRDLYLDYSRSKTGVPMIIRIFPPVLSVIKYLKNSVVFTHIDKRVANRGIIRGLEDRLNIFEYDKSKYNSFHRQLWKTRQNKFTSLSEDGIKFKNARSTFYQQAQGIEDIMEADVKMLVGHKIEVSTDSYASVKRPAVVRKMNEQHRQVLESYNYQYLVNQLIKKLSKLCINGAAPKWVLNNAISGDGKTMLTVKFNEDGKVVNNAYEELEIESKYLKYFKNQKDIEVDLKESIRELNKANKTVDIVWKKIS